MLELLATLGVGAVLGGLVTHFLGTSAREAERQYERTLQGYGRLLVLSRNMLESNIEKAGKEEIEKLARAVDRSWLYASDDVLLALYAVIDQGKAGIQRDKGHDTQSDLILKMRNDLWKKQGWRYKLFPWRSTSLKAADYQLLGPGDRASAPKTPASRT